VEPSDPEATVVLQDLEALGNVVANNLYRYHRDTGYELYPHDFSDVALGRGYWLYLYHGDDAGQVSVQGTFATEDVALGLSRGWNLVGYPFLQAQLLMNCRVTDGAVTKSFGDAVASGWVGGSLYYWEPGTGYGLLTAAGYGAENSLRPWRGYWIHAGQDGLALVVPVPDP
jgi:hypothetical protein